MTDQFINTNGGTPKPLIPNSVSADGNSPYSDGDYTTDTEQPVILELGTKPSTTFGGASNLNAYSAAARCQQMHMNLNSGSAFLSSQHLSYEGEQVIPSISPHMTNLYNNPYLQHSLPPTTTITPMNGSSGLQGDTGYSPHIPQPVCSWPTPDMEARFDLVPPAMYLSYMGTREHHILKETNPSWREKALQIEKDYKKTACDRERTRMRDMNKAFDLLRSKLPAAKSNGKKFSKIESLRIAINYINYLQTVLEAEPGAIDLLPNLLPGGSQFPCTAANFLLDITPRRRSRSALNYEFRRMTYREMLQEQLNYRKITQEEMNEVPSGSWSDNGYVPNGQ